MPVPDAQTEKLLKDAEKAQKRVAKERERLIKQQQKEEELKKKQEEKERILAEKKFKKEQEEKEKEEKRKQREEEKRQRELKREEEEQKKEEFRKKKEEERLQKEEEKRKEEEENERIKNKQKALFTSFFIKKDGTEDKSQKVTSTSVKVSKLFMQFELKKDMMICPVSRVSEQSRSTKAIDLENCDNSTNYFSDLKSPHYKIGKSAATWPFEIPDLMLVTDASTSSRPLLHQSKWMKAKFLQFVENNRPAYYGTWRKSSKVVSARRPFVQDNLFFDYEIDSDDEWEEEEPGENISHSEGENEEEEEEVVEEDDDDEENDGFCVPHGYLSDDEGAEAEDDDVTPEIRKIRQQLEEKQYELSQKKKIQPLRPVINGIRWLDKGEDDGDVLRQYKMHLWTNIPIICSVEEVLPCATPASKSPKRKEIPEEALLYLAQILNKNPLSFSKLAYEFRMFWQKLITGVLPDVSYEEDKKGQSWGLFQISKSQLKKQVKTMASYDGSCWNLLPEIIEKYSASKFDEAWSYVTDINLAQTKPKKKENNKKKEPAEPNVSDPVASPNNFIEKFTEPTTPSKPVATPLSTSNTTLNPESESKPQKRLYITNFFPAVTSPSAKKSKTVHYFHEKTPEKNPNNIHEAEVIILDS